MCILGWPEGCQGLARPEEAGGPEEGGRGLGELKVAFHVHETLVWDTAPDEGNEAKVVAASAPRTPPSTRAGGQDDVS